MLKEKLAVVMVKSWKQKCGCTTQVLQVQQDDQAKAAVSERLGSNRIFKLIPLRAMWGNFRDIRRSTHTQRHVHLLLWPCAPMRALREVITSRDFWSADQCQWARGAPFFCWKPFILSGYLHTYNPRTDNLSRKDSHSFFLPTVHRKIPLVSHSSRNN